MYDNALRNRILHPLLRKALRLKRCADE